MVFCIFCLRIKRALYKLWNTSLNALTEMQLPTTFSLVPASAEKRTKSLAIFSQKGSTVLLLITFPLGRPPLFKKRTPGIGEMVFLRAGDPSCHPSISVETLWPGYRFRDLAACFLHPNLDLWWKGCWSIYAACQCWHCGATGRALDCSINRSLVQILLGAKLRNNLGQVVHTYVPLSPSSITWYRPRGCDALRLGR